MMSEHDWSQEFPHQNDLIHLNHAGVGPWPKTAYDAVLRFASQNIHHSTKLLAQWEQTESELRTQCKELIHADNKEDIALIKNTSEGLSMVAYGIPWNAHDNIIFAKQEFPSNRIVWQSLAQRYNVEPRCVDLYAADSPEQSIFQNIDENTRLISVSAVQFSNGLRLNLEIIGEYCRANQILFCIDAIQHLGAIPFDVKKFKADFIIADAHKWLLSPEGIGMFYCNPEIRDEIQLNQFGWHMMENVGDYESLEWRPATTARKFECGSLNNLGIQAMHASLDLLLQIGIDAIYEKISSNISYLIDLFENLDLNFLSDLDSERRSGIITVAHPSLDNYQLFKFLLKSNVLCAFRGGGIRFSPHFYIQKQQLETVAQLIKTVST